MFGSMRAIAATISGLVVLSAAPPPGDLLFRNVRVFDGQRVIARTDVWIGDEKIRAIGQNLKVPAGTPAMEGSGRTLLPGFIDAHNHSYTRTGLEQELIFGVTTELGMQNDPAFVAEIKREQASGQSLNLADMRSSGWPATAPGGHGTEGGLPVPVITAPDQAAGFVQQRRKAGSDYLKIIFEDGSLFHGKSPNLTKSTVAALARAAHDAGLLAVAHIGNRQGAIDTIEAGVDGLAHLFIDRPPEPGFGSFVADHRAFAIPTLTVLDSASRKPSGASLATDARLEPYLTLEAIRNLTTTGPHKLVIPVNFDYALQTVKQLRRAGVPILAGTDAPSEGTWFGASIHRELELLVHAGMTPIEALAAATSVPASIFHLTDRGGIAKGKRADLVLVNGDPSKDIKHTRAIVGVWKRGVRVDRESLRSQISRQKAENAKLRRAAPPRGSASGIISNFEDGKLAAAFGTGWSTTTGESKLSTVAMTVVQSGAGSSGSSMQISGEIKSDTRYPIAGAVFSPGATPLLPANLSLWKNLSFWVKGNGGACQLLVFTHSGGDVPAIQPFSTDGTWRRVVFPFTSLGNSDGFDISSVLFVAGPKGGKFTFQLDDVALGRQPPRRHTTRQP